jgi:AraC family transcriptional regulator
MSEYGKRHDECRVVTGELVSSATADTSLVRVEMLRRKSSRPINWHFQQPRLALFWFRDGVERMRLRLDGKVVQAELPAKGRLTLVPACFELEGEFEVKPYCDYSVVFIENALFQRFARQFDKPLLAFRDRSLEQGLAMLCHEAATADSLFELYAEGWALQALAHIMRTANLPGPPPAPRGGLTGGSLKRVNEFIEANLDERISLAALAQTAGVSKRHFLRAFQESMGQTPLSYVQSVRLEKAKQLLMDAERSATEVALECGFCHLQNFSDKFKKATGLTPTAFRKSITK